MTAEGGAAEEEEDAGEKKDLSPEEKAREALKAEIKVSGSAVYAWTCSAAVLYVLISVVSWWVIWDLFAF